MLDGYKVKINTSHCHSRHSFTFWLKKYTTLLYLGNGVVFFFTFDKNC